MLELAPRLLGLTRLMITRESGGGKGIDAIGVPQASAMPVDHASGIARRLNVLPDALIAWMSRLRNRGPIHHLIESLHFETAADVLSDLLVSIVPATYLERGGRSRRT